MIINFDTKGNEKQKECARYWADSITEQILYGGAKYGGKSVIGCNLIFGDAMMYPETRYFVARDSLTDLRRYTIPSVYEVFGLWGLDYRKYLKYNGQDNYFDLYNGSRVEFIDASYSPSDPEYHRFGSRQYTRGWCEEIGDMDTGAIENLNLTIGRWKNLEYGLLKKLLMSCNPHKGYGYREFYKPAKAGELDVKKKFIIALPSDNKAGDPAYIESIINNPNTDIRERLGKGNWEFDDDDSILIPYEKILAIFTNTEIRGRKCMTNDLARLGGDRIVRMEWDGWVGTVYATSKQTLDITTTQIESARFRMNIAKRDVLVDADGLGSGVQDFGGFTGFNNGARPLPDPKNPIRDKKGNPQPENFDNLKSQCGFRMADRINIGMVKLICTEDWMKPLIIEELEQVKQKRVDSDMKNGLMPKDKVKDAIGRSPDFWDCILMREFFELKPKFVSTATAI